MGFVDLEPAGDQAFLLRFGRAITPELHGRVLAALAALDRARPPWVVDVVPAYASLLIEYDGARVTAGEARAALAPMVAAAPPALAPPAREVEVPVLYDPAVAPDLLPLAEDRGGPPADLSAWHTAAAYRVYAL